MDCFPWHTLIDRINSLREQAKRFVYLSTDIFPNKNIISWINIEIAELTYVLEFIDFPAGQVAYIGGIYAIENNTDGSITFFNEQEHSIKVIDVPNRNN